MKLSSTTRLSLSLASWLCLASLSPAANKDVSWLNQTQVNLRCGQFEQACATADQGIAANDPASEELLYLKATAQFHHKKFADTTATIDTLLQKFPQSPWLHKATFLKAQALIEQRKFAEASKIYESEASRLLSPERKQALASEILRFAEKLETKPDANTPDAPQPDFAKAYSLYSKALTLELPREFRDDILFRKARAIQRASQISEAINNFNAYLAAYDPTWTGPSGNGSAKANRLNPPPAGKHVALARFHLAEAQITAQQTQAARMGFEDLLKMISSPPPASALAQELNSPECKDLVAEIRWKTVLSYFNNHPNIQPRNAALSQNNSIAQIGNTGGLPTTDSQIFTVNPDEADIAIKTCRDYLKNHPSGSRSIRAAWMIAEALQANDHADEAISAYRDVIACRGFSLPEGNAATTLDEEIRSTPATHLATLQMRALHRIGTIQANQLQYEAAIATWQTYIKEHPNGPEWSICQNDIINAEFQLGIIALSSEQMDLAIQRFNAFLQAHPLDERAARILYLFGAIYEDKAIAAEETNKPTEEIQQHYRKAIEEWAKLVSKYPDAPAAEQALFSSARILENKLGEYEKALKLYQKIVADRHHPLAVAAIQRLTQKSLSVKTERVFRTNESPVVKLNTRNIESCEIRLYRIDLQAYFRKMHQITGVEKLDVSLIQPDKTWTYKPKNYRKYQALEDSVEIPFPDDSAGACVVTISDDDWESSVLVLRSDIEMIVKSSRKEILAFAQNMRTGQPASNVDLLLSDGKAVTNTGKTGPDGVFKTSIDALKDLSDIRVFALQNNHSCSYNLDLTGLSHSEAMMAKGYLYSDRGTYLPGETVAIRGILRDVQNDRQVIPNPNAFSIRINDSDGRTISDQNVTLNEFGSFNLSLNLPNDARLGNYSIIATQNTDEHSALTFTGEFSVREFKLEKIKLALDAPKRVLFRGEKLDATITATYYWGEPIANRELICTLPDNRTQRINTDASGKAQISFDTTAILPGTPIQISASLDGENVSIHESFFVANAGFSIAANPSQDLIIAGESVNLNVSTTSANNKPTSEKLTLTVLRHPILKTPRIFSLLNWPETITPASDDIKISEQSLQTDEKSGKTSVSLKLDQGGAYSLRVSGTDRLGQPISTTTELTVSDQSDDQKLRWFAESSILKVGDDSKIRLHSRLTKGLALVTFEGETILRYQIVKLHQDYLPIPTTISHDLFPNFTLSVAAIDGNKIHSANKEFTVERELKIELTPTKPYFAPGEKTQFDLTVTDQNGKPVVAELSFALANEALFAVAPDLTPSIVEYFHADAQRYAEFKLGATCNFSYQGTSRAVSKAIKEEKDRISRADAEEMKRKLNEREFDGLSASGALRANSRGGVGVGGGWGGKPMADQNMPPAPREALDGAAEFAAKPAAKMLAAQNAAYDGDAFSQPETPARIETKSEFRWLPAIVTDKNGKAQVPITLPDATSAWKLTVRGCTVDTLVGETFSSTLTRKDYFVNMKLPSFLREGDELRVVGRVHNMSNFTGKATLNLRAFDANDRSKALISSETTVDLKANAGAEVTFPAFTIPNAKNLIFDLSSSAGTEKDHLEQSVAVQPWGIPYANHAGGIANADANAILSLPKDRAYQSLWMNVNVGPAVDQTIIDMALRNAVSIQELTCIMPPEMNLHPANELLALSSALKYLNSSNPDHENAAILTTRCRALLTSLITAQQANGSWKSSAYLGPFTTARIFWALTSARNAGLKINTDAYQKAGNYLNKQLAELDANDSDGKAIILHALSCNNQADFAACNRLYRDRNALNPTTLAYLTRAFHQINRVEIATELATLLETKIQDQPVPLASGYKLTWLNDSTETTAIALLALAESKPESKLTQSLAQSLMQCHGCYGFPSNRSHGPAISALTQWLGKGQAQQTDLEISVQVNGTAIQTLKSGKNHRQVALSIPANILKPENNLVELKTKGQGRFAYTATLFGFSSDMPPSDPTTTLTLNEIKFTHAPIEYRGKPISAASSSPVKNLENGQRTRVSLSRNNRIAKTGKYSVQIALPPGAMLDESSLTTNSNSDIPKIITPSSITLYFDHYLNHVSFDLIGYSPGTFRMLPPVIREIGNPSYLGIGTTSSLRILAANEKSTDGYEMNIAEKFTLGTCYFNDGDEAKALEFLSAVFKDSKQYDEANLARMLLWIHTNPKFYDANKIVELFEILRERYPSLEIPFDRILVVSKAYQDIREYERAWLVYRATINASFTNDSSLSAILEDEGKFLGSIDYQERVWRDYPDTADVTSSYFALSQLLYQKASEAHTLPKEDGIQPEKISMLIRTGKLLQNFLAYYPNNPLSDDASFSLCNCLLDLKNYQGVVSLSREFATQYAKNPLAPSFQYMCALGYFWQKLHPQALEAARVVANGNSKDNNLARYILGQIYHAENKPAEALEWYHQVETLYPDAADAIRYFENQSIALEEVTMVKPGSPTTINLKYRNIKEAFIQIYRVDLMKLYLQQKNLGAITSVQLAGIKPEIEQTITLGNGKDYVEKERSIQVPLKDEAAYLVICRGDNLFTSGMVLITPLKIEIQEDANSGRVRANVLDTTKGGYRPEVHVKAIGSENASFQSGETDLRGLFIADNIRGKATVIAREGNSRYAFYRGTNDLGQRSTRPTPPTTPTIGQESKAIDYQGNLLQHNNLIQTDNNENFNRNRRQSQNKGIKVDDAK